MENYILFSLSFIAGIILTCFIIIPISKGIKEEEYLEGYKKGFIDGYKEGRKEK